MSRGEPAPPKHLVEKDKVSQLLSLVDPLSYHWWSEGGPGLNLFLSCGPPGRKGQVISFNWSYLLIMMYHVSSYIRRLLREPTLHDEAAPYI